MTKWWCSLVLCIALVGLGWAGQRSVRVGAGGGIQRGTTLAYNTTKGWQLFLETLKKAEDGKKLTDKLKPKKRLEVSVPGDSFAWSRGPYVVYVECAEQSAGSHMPTGLGGFHLP